MEVTRNLSFKLTLTAKLQCKSVKTPNIKLKYLTCGREKFLSKIQVPVDIANSDTKWGMVCMVKMSRIFLVVIFLVILEFFCLLFILDFLYFPIFSLKSRL